MGDSVGVGVSGLAGGRFEISSLSILNKFPVGRESNFTASEALLAGHATSGILTGDGAREGWRQISRI